MYFTYKDTTGRGIQTKDLENYLTETTIFFDFRCFSLDNQYLCKQEVGVHWDIAKERKGKKLARFQLVTLLFFILS